MKAGDTHYDVLGVAPTVEAVALRKAYVGLARTFHPDFHAGESVEVQAHAEAMMVDINRAWEVLGSPASRARYDKELKSKGLLIEDAYGTARPAAATHEAPVRTTGSAPPRWLTMLPALFLVLAVGAFAVGMVTGLAAMLAAAIGCALLGGLLFAFVPMVALKRASEPMPDGPTVHA